MKKFTIIFLTALTLTFSLTGCGNSAELESLKVTDSEKDAIIAEKDSQIADLNNQINELNATITDLQKQLENLQSEYDSLSDKVSNKTSLLDEGDYKGNDPNDLSTRDFSYYEKETFKTADLNGDGVLDATEQGLYDFLLDAIKNTTAEPVNGNTTGGSGSSGSGGNTTQGGLPTIPDDPNYQGTYKPGSKSDVPPGEVY